MQAPEVDTEKLNRLIEDVTASGGAEMANAQMFVLRLTEALGLPQPDFAAEQNEQNDYTFERRVDFKHPDGSRTLGRIDCYKRGSFILEAKQSGKREKARDASQLALLPEDASQRKAGQAKRGTRKWDDVMIAARRQAEDYARALPVSHGYPPFILVVDVGNVIEMFADFSGQGKNYAHFPDRRSYRIAMDDLRDEEVQQRLAAIWLDPHSLDPARRSAEVTRDIAERLAKIARRLEGKHEPGAVAEFLMRCLFTMFAEDVDLIPRHSFENLLETLKDKPEQFVPAMEHLWKVMNAGGYEPRLMTPLKTFNGSLFKNARALPLDGDAISELWIAAKRDWRDVEPAIFGTLLERALDKRERSKLGAHYTPRAYVERLVVPTIIEPLRADWELVQASVKGLHEKGQDDKAIAAVKAFHHKLCTTRVLDPACGTANFLYVSLELMKRLEGEVLEALDDLGEDAPKFAMEGETVGPRQFFGLEINPRAVAIADLVLWIGYIKWQLKTNGLSAITEPVLHSYGNILQQDAILAYDAKELARDETGKPLARWDGFTMKLHPVTGEEVPDGSATVPVYTYENPRRAVWPEAEFIVGNPPFIGGGVMRGELGDGYAEAVWKARPKMPAKADFVMHFWEEAATRLARKGTAKQPNPLRRFGFITTNSITQTFSRRVIEGFLADEKKPLSLVYAVPDHPWLKASDKAAVRIAMTVAEAGAHDGVLAEVVKEEGLNTDTPDVELEQREGKITAKLTIGADLILANRLLANLDVSSNGFMLAGGGFTLQAAQADQFLRKYKGVAENLVRPYLNGRDLVQKPRGVFVLDLFSFSEEELARRVPDIYQYVLETVKPYRLSNNRKSFRENWWKFGEPRKLMREFMGDIPRYIATTETTKHRTFQFVGVDVAPDHMLLNIGLDRPGILAVLSSRMHIHYAIEAGGWLGIGNDPRYSKSKTFDPFPFPAVATDQSLDPALYDRLSELGERLDAFRKERLEKHDFLTMTGLYNVMERLRELENGADVPPLSDKERDIHEAGLVTVLKEIHDEIDRAAFAAYGWDDLADRIVGKPGATLPSPHKSEDQEAAEEELLSRLVALNVERQKEEAAGHVRWLRPDYQIAKLGDKVPKPDDEAQADLDIATPMAAAAGKVAWPKDQDEQIRIVRDILVKAPAPAAPDDLSAAIDGRSTQKRKDRIADVLDLLVSVGGARRADGETPRYFVPR
ncbi:class I SAM-dependent DNA methyltransferase [Notoacmeibacter ruber]|uniref:site-specific DNA-methyltransferase (adenine-specific) n=1 Tax=Notoacmeibacter ruber TaxID=2670375 RepID=A0A3L7JDC2_9HYPH|nr:DNA methyltransferase [Notoacmeibacter ruber]RLQ88470.1 class I SAM-dependent DNA methyltransferase [Notoacmeibacter ruber]